MLKRDDPDLETKSSRVSSVSGRKQFQQDHRVSSDLA